MNVGDEVLILETASAEDYENIPGWDIEMDNLVGTKGTVGAIDGDLAYVTPMSPAIRGLFGYDGYWWKLRDLLVILPDKWRRGKCG